MAKISPAGKSPTKPKRTVGSVKDGVMVNDTPKKDFSAYGDHANIRTVKDFEDFRLHIEFKPPAGGNSGVYLRGMYEVQVVDRDSKMQGLQGVGSIFGRIKAKENAGKPGGEWNSYDITLVDRHVTVILNGKKVIDNDPVPGTDRRSHPKRCDYAGTNLSARRSYFGRLSQHLDRTSHQITD